MAGNFRTDLAVAGDFGGQYRTLSGVSVSFYEYLFGPQLRFRTDRSSAFVHVLVGGATARGSVAGASTSSSGFAMGFGGGLDVQVTKTMAIRVIQLDYLPDHIGSWGHNVRLGFGVVFQEGAGRKRMPGRRHRR